MNKIVLIFVKTEHEWRVFIETEVLLTQIYTAERPSFISPYLIGRSTFEDHCFSQQVLGFSWMYGTSVVCDQVTPKSLTIICYVVFKLDREFSCITTIFGNNESESLSLWMSEAQKNYISLDRVSLQE